MAVFRRTQAKNVVIFTENEAIENDENAGFRRGKAGLAVARAPLQDRTVALQNVVQAPSAKQSFKLACTGQENISVVQATKPCLQTNTFAIFKDDDPAVVSSEAISHMSIQPETIGNHEEMELNPAVTDLCKPCVAPSSLVFDYPSEEPESNVTIESAMMSLCSPEDEMSEDESCEDAEVKTIENVKHDDRHLWFPAYQRDIYKYLREAEARHSIRADYMRKQTDITHSMRSILVDWLVEVAEEYKLDRETLSLSVCYVDRFLSVMAVVRAKLQLVGATAMFIASKYEEIYPPEVGEFVYITDNTYTKKQVLQMERLMLRTLGFNVASPTVNCFCTNLLTNLDVDDRTRSLAMFLLELSMLDGERFLKYVPSVISASCVCVAFHACGLSEIMSSVSELTGYLYEDLISCISDVVAVFSTAASLPHPAIREKYSKDKWHCVSGMTPISAVPERF